MDSFWEASIILSNFLGSLQHEAICLTRHQQISLLAAVRQGDLWIWSPPWKQCQTKLKSPVFLPSHREAHRHEKDPLYRRTDSICAETGRNRHSGGGSLQKDGHFWSHILHVWTTSVLQVLNLFLGCCLHLSGIRKICAQMGNSHTIASPTGRPLRPV